MAILLNVLLNFTKIQHPSILRLLNRLLNQFHMFDSLSRLHNPDDGRLSLILSVLNHAFVCFFVFFLRFLELDLVDFDAEFVVMEGRVQTKGVRGKDVAALGCFGEDAVFAAGEGLKGPGDFMVSWMWGGWLEA